MDAFIIGLDSFPRLFVIQTFNLAFGTRDERPAASIVELQSSSARPPLRSRQRAAPVGRRNPDLTHGRTVQPVDRGVDLLHLDPERPGRLHQGHGARSTDQHD